MMPFRLGFLLVRNELSARQRCVFLVRLAYRGPFEHHIAARSLIKGLPIVCSDRVFDTCQIEHIL